MSWCSTVDDDDEGAAVIRATSQQTKGNNCLRFLMLTYYKASFVLFRQRGACFPSNKNSNSYPNVDITQIINRPDHSINQFSRPYRINQRDEKK